MSGAATMSLKARLNHFAKAKKVNPMTVLQNYMFERFLERLSVSEFRDRFVLKGGCLISSMVGIAARSTMDVDATVVDMNLTMRDIRTAVIKIVHVALEDGVSFSIQKVDRIKVKAEGYDGLRVKMLAMFEDELRVPFSIDFTKEGSIGSGFVKYRYPCQFTAGRSIPLRAYSLETVLAEKCETILQRNVLTTRPRDFYDVYLLSKFKHIRKTVFARNLRSTCEARGTGNLLERWEEIVKMIEGSTTLRRHWARYQRDFEFASAIEFVDAISAVRQLLSYL